MGEVGSRDAEGELIVTGLHGSEVELGLVLDVGEGAILADDAEERSAVHELVLLLAFLGGRHGWRVEGNANFLLLFKDVVWNHLGVPGVVGDLWIDIED